MVSTTDEHGGVIINTEKGKFVGRIAIPEGSTLLAARGSASGAILLTEGFVLGYDVSGCVKENGGKQQMLPTAVPKN